MQQFSRQKLRNCLLAAFFAVLASVGGFLSIPALPVPFTMQSFVVLLSGLLLGPVYGPLSQLFYILMGLVGIPVFAGGTGGLHCLLMPTFGFIVGFIAMSFTAAVVAGRGRRSCGRYLCACAAATVMLYVIGIPWIYLNLNYAAGSNVTLAQTFGFALVPFIIPDSLKAIAAACLAAKLPRELMQ